MNKLIMVFSLLLCTVVLVGCIGGDDTTNGDNDTPTNGNDSGDTPYPTGGLGVKSLSIECDGTSIIATNNGSVNVSLDNNEIRDNTNIVSHLEGTYEIGVGESATISLVVDIGTDYGVKEYRLMFEEINERGGTDVKHYAFQC